jgi:hypothetical protein
MVVAGEERTVVKEIRVVLDSWGKGKREREKVAVRGKSALKSINMCV